ncbi:metallophosphoesterase [Candidatus Vecturithrix granuli]|uniref:Metallophosphoesterase n=1 Tax=Vecturithrix granuli TaxID=1499967 RepID=A0A081CA28_VECG1|nr:metallophosphoesterase [Candidatus Vecturithrix granuli]
MQTHALVAADAHLDGMNQELDIFLAFLTFVRENSIKTLYLLGDLFTIWLGTPKFTLPHHSAVIQALSALKEAGTQVNYVEGNRDYFLAPRYLNKPFYQIGSESLQETIGEKRFYFAHGDLVNVYDRPYRLWRGLSRNPWLFSLFRAIPRPVAISLAQYLEQQFQATNQQHKASFPETVCRMYAEERWKAGIDMIILGHFHEAQAFSAPVNGKSHTLQVLPAWKDTHEYLVIDEEGNFALRGFSQIRRQNV